MVADIHSCSPAETSVEDLVLTPAEWRKVEFVLSESNPIHAGYVTASPVSGPDWDMHYGLELGIVLRGRMRRHWAGWHRDVGPGQVWLCGMWERHGWEALTSSCRHLVLVLLPQWLVRCRFAEALGWDWLAPFAAAPRERPQAVGQQRREILAIARRFEPSISPESAVRPAFLELLGLELLLVLLRGWRSRRRTRSADVELQLELVNRAVEMALQSRRLLTTGEAAEACGMNARAFARTFRELMGTSFAQFAMRSRLGQAAGQLASGTDSVSSVAERWGFLHVSSFQRAFRRHYGVSPISYRAKRG
jgi:AraC-like DNA-binding protein